MNELLKNLRRTWGTLAQAACWIGVAIGTFVPEPPLTTLTAPPDVALKRFAQFLGAVVLGVLLVLCRKWQQREHVKAWIVVTAVMATLTLGAFFGERAARSAWTCGYAGRTITIGTRLTSDAQAYSSKLGGEATCDRLLADYGGDAFQVWHREDSERHYLLLSVLMIAIWLGSASCIISVTQALRCATADPNPRRRVPAPAANKKEKSKSST
jgi:hypothetical protein